MKRLYTFVISVFMIFILAGCSAAQQPVEQSVDVGKEIEQFGFVFTIPQGVTSNGIDDGIYDIDFGIVGQREAFIGINPPEDLPEQDGDKEDLLQLQLENMQQSVYGFFDNIGNEVMEIRQLDGNPAGYIGLNCTIQEVPVHWQIYMVILDDTLYSFTIQVYTNAITEDTLATIDRFVEEIKLTGASAF